jgi:hypothetical protein
MRRHRRPAQKARIHTGEVRRSQYRLASLINKVKIARDAPRAAGRNIAPTGLSRA